MYIHIYIHIYIYMYIYIYIYISARLVAPHRTQTLADAKPSAFADIPPYVFILTVRYVLVLLSVNMSTTMHLRIGSISQRHVHICMRVCVCVCVCVCIYIYIYIYQRHVHICMRWLLWSCLVWFHTRPSSCMLRTLMSTYDCSSVQKCCSEWEMRGKKYCGVWSLQMQHCLVWCS